MPVRSALGTAVVLVIVLTACGAEPPSTPGAPGMVPTTSAPATAPSADQVGRTHRVALGLIALGELGAEKGSTQARRSLALRIATDGRALDEQIRELATAGGLALGDDVGPGTQDVLVDLRARSSGGFDDAWLRGVTDLVGQGREAADDLESTPSREAASLARNVQARLAALSNALRKATTRAAAPTPTR